MKIQHITEPESAGCILLAADTGRWGLQQRSDTVGDPGLWAAWGGGRESGETLEQCVRRELAEESGYSGPVKLEPLAHNARYATFIGVVPHEFEPRPCNEWKDFAWVELGHWPEPLHPGVAEALLKLNESNRKVEAPGKTVVNAILSILPNAQEIWFHGSRAIEKHRPNSDTDILVVVPDNIVGEQYFNVVRALQKISKQFYNYDIQPTKTDTNIYKIAKEEGKLLWSAVSENFADGKVKGKSRPGRVKRAGASCAGSVTDLRAKAKKYSGEKGKMYHWCANMKSGKKNK